MGSLIEPDREPDHKWRSHSFWFEPEWVGHNKNLSARRIYLGEDDKLYLHSKGAGLLVDDIQEAYQAHKLDKEINTILLEES